MSRKEVNKNGRVALTTMPVCHSGVDAYGKDRVLDCCEPGATGGQCEFGCYTEAI